MRLIFSLGQHFTDQYYYTSTTLWMQMFKLWNNYPEPEFTQGCLLRDYKKIR